MSPNEYQSFFQRKKIKRIECRYFCCIVALGQFVFELEKVVMHQVSIACSVHFRHRISPCLRSNATEEGDLDHTVRVTNILRLDDNDVSKLSLLFCSHMHHP